MLRQGEDRLAHGLGQVKADREADPALAGPLEQLVRRSGRVAAKQLPPESWPAASSPLLSLDSAFGTGEMLNRG